MPLYGRYTMTNLPLTLAPAEGWECALEVETNTELGFTVAYLPMSESDVRELIEQLQDALR